MKKKTELSGKETYALFDLPIQNRDSAIKSSLPLFDFFELKGKDHLRRKINSKKSAYMRHQHYYFDLA